MAAVVLLSGGLDSAVNLKRAVDEVGVVLALTFDYGQRAAARELAVAAAMSAAVGVPHRALAFPWLAEICGTALVNPDAEVPALRPEQLGDARRDGGRNRVGGLGAQSQWRLHQHRGRLCGEPGGRHGGDRVQCGRGRDVPG